MTKDLMTNICVKILTPIVEENSFLESNYTHDPVSNKASPSSLTIYTDMMEIKK